MSSKGKYCESVVDSSLSSIIGKANDFVLKTFHMVEYCNQNHPDILCWCRNGSKFIVKNLDRLGKQIIPQYFESHDHTSFFRQLNYYKFQKTRLNKSMSLDLYCSSENTDFFKVYVFEHEFFRQDQTHLLPRVSRTTYGKKKETEKEISSLKTEIACLEEKIHKSIEECNRKAEFIFDSYEKKFNQLKLLKEEQEKSAKRNTSSLGNKHETEKCYLEPVKPKIQNAVIFNLSVSNAVEKKSFHLERQDSCISIISMSDKFFENFNPEAEDCNDLDWNIKHLQRQKSLDSLIIADKILNSIGVLKENKSKTTIKTAEGRKRKVKKRDIHSYLDEYNISNANSVIEHKTHNQNRFVDKENGVKLERKRSWSLSRSNSLSINDKSINKPPCEIVNKKLKRKRSWSLSRSTSLSINDKSINKCLLERGCSREWILNNLLHGGDGNSSYDSSFDFDGFLTDALKAD